MTPKLTRIYLIREDNMTPEEEFYKNRTGKVGSQKQDPAQRAQQNKPKVEKAVQDLRNQVSQLKDSFSKLHELLRHQDGEFDNLVHGSEKRLKSIFSELEAEINDLTNDNEIPAVDVWGPNAGKPAKADPWFK